MKKLILFLTVILLFTLGMIAQSKTKKTTPKNTKTTSDIRQTDFKNFTYKSNDGGSFRLRNGKYKQPIREGESFALGTRFDRIVYGDLTDDGNDEAIIILVQEVSVSSAEQYVYIYTVKNGQVSKLADFLGGTSGCIFEGEECSILDVKIQSGELVIDRAIPTDQDAKCCPSLHRLTKYRWRENQLVEVGKSRIMKKS